MKNYFGIRSGVENGTVVFKVGAEGAVVNEVTVMRDADGAKAVTGDKGLYVFKHGLAGGGVTDVANS